MANKKILTAGVFILLTLIGGGIYLVSETDQPSLYACNSTGKEIVGLCFKLSKVNSGGTQTRCYYNESSPRKYKNCRTGWYPVNLTNAKGIEVNLPTHEVISIKREWADKKLAEDYIINLTNGLTHKITKTKIVERPFSNEKEVYFIIQLFKGEDMIYYEEISSKVPSDYTTNQIDSVLEKHSSDFVKNWKPDIRIVNEP